MHWKAFESLSKFLGNCKGNKYVTGPNKGWTKPVWNFYLPLTLENEINGDDETDIDFEDNDENM